MHVLTVNAGSSSLKLSLVGEHGRTLAATELEARHGEVPPDALRRALDSDLAQAHAVGHRIVHGGQRFSAPTLIDGEVLAAVHELAALAPLHQGPSLAALAAVSETLPHLPAVACFDTAFHATIGADAATYPLPEEWSARWRLRRYGFHGLSHGWVARRVSQLLDREGARRLRIVSAHLGSGASLCAIEDGRSRETTMGFTPLEGLMMATRSGSVDPGLLLWLIEHEGVDASVVSEALERRSGLLGLAGSADMREVLAAAGSGDARAQLALDVYSHRLRGGIASMAAALRGIDVLVFTGGVGEHAPAIRTAAADGLRFLGVELDPERNSEGGEEREIGALRAPVRVFVIPAREDLEIAREVRATLQAA